MEEDHAAVADAVVIGVGPNGLVAANLPADAGPAGGVHGAPGTIAARAAPARTGRRRIDATGGAAAAAGAAVRTAAGRR